MLKTSVIALGLLGTTSCAAFKTSVVPIIDDVLLVGQDALAILNAIHAAEVIFFLAQPNPALQTKVETAIGDANIALDAATQAASGAKDLGASDADAAFAAFRQSYQDLVALVGQLGIAQHGPDGRVGLKRGGEMKWHQPLALQRKVGG